MQADVSPETVRASDTRGSYYESGEGRTILLLHGFDGDKSERLPVTKILTKHFQVIIPDLPAGAIPRA
jgi:abhydrolase domain-containing protein 6